MSEMPSAESDAPSMGQWAHDVADQYRDLAARETWEPRRSALEAEAAKYDGIGRRMDRIPRVTPPAKCSSCGRPLVHEFGSATHCSPESWTTCRRRDLPPVEGDA